jgi:hypothetical protein
MSAQQILAREVQPNEADREKKTSRHVYASRRKPKLRRSALLAAACVGRSQAGTTAFESHNETVFPTLVLKGPLNLLQ